ncbi:TolB family protein [Paenibacillus macquariensis]|nr:hypothetical protein [Paenibacillus macquariensis]MEC0091138.1 hypothetical protein [Paenibacillus macquariensis]OAB33678.1 hypothetical protein PMSM_13710 [Paenibacillus macquariensis subsp. macquariensis]
MMGNRMKYSKSWLTTFIIFLLITGCTNTKVTGYQPNVKHTTLGESLKEYTYKGWQAALDGNLLAYLSGNGQQLTVMDLDKNQELVQIQLPSYECGFDISGDYIVWSDLRNEKKNISDLGSVDIANADIFLYDLKTGQQRPLTEDTSSQVNPKIWGHYLVWMDNRNDADKDYPSDWQIALYDLNTDEMKIVTNAPGGQTDPDINDGFIVWEDGRNVKTKGIRAGSNLPENNTDIYLYDIAKGNTIPIATGPKKEGRPQISGNRVVWEDYSKGTYSADVSVYYLDTQQSGRITNLQQDQSEPVIYGDYIAWMDERRGTSTNDVIENGQKPNSDIYLYDLNTKTEMLMTGDEPQLQPLLSDHWLIYTTSRQVDPELHAVRYK